MKPYPMKLTYIESNGNEEGLCCDINLSEKKASQFKNKDNFLFVIGVGR